MTFYEALPIICLSITAITQARWISRLSMRINNLEAATHLREWIDAINNGESASNMAYMKEKGFLK